MKFIFTAITLLFIFSSLHAQNVGVNTNSPAHPFQVNVDQLFYDTIIDQSVMTGSTQFNITANQRIGQSIVTGMDGTLFGLTFMATSTSTELTIEITTGAQPGGQLLTQQVVSITSPDWTQYTIYFPPPLQAVTAGTPLFISINHTDGNIMHLRSNNSNPYATGQAYFYNNSWFPQPAIDMVFQTLSQSAEEINTPVLQVQSNGRMQLKNYALPEFDGASGQVLQTDGNGDVKWQATHGLPVSLIQDADHDTRVETESTPDEDKIRFSMRGAEKLSLTENNHGLFRIDIPDSLNNLLIGHEAGLLIEPVPGYDPGHNLLYIGHQAGRHTTHGWKNVGLGPLALFQNTTGSFNIAIGDRALFSNIDGRNNVAIGSTALYSNTTGEMNVAIGKSTLGFNTTGSFNCSLGWGSMAQNTTGSQNTAFGATALWYNTTGYDNVAIGRRALEENEAGYEHTAVGSFALSGNETGLRNTAIGWSALRSNMAGIGNTAAGHNSLADNLAGDHNAAFGISAMQGNSEGNSNTGIGAFALQQNTIASFRTALGYSANSTGTNYPNSTGIGYNADVTASNQVRIGNSAVTSIGGFTNWTNVSDERFKINVQENIPGLNFITGLRPVTYQFDMQAIDQFWADHYHERDTLFARGDDKASMIQSGFIAQEVEALADSLGFEFSGVDRPKHEDDFYGLRYAEFVVPLVKAVQELDAQNKLLAEQVNLLREEVESLKGK